MSVNFVIVMCPLADVKNYRQRYGFMPAGYFTLRQPEILADDSSVNVGFVDTKWGDAK
jgi:hypothetical protein